MRRILVDYARSHRAEKRGGGWDKLAFDEASRLPQNAASTWLRWTTRSKISRLDPLQSQIVELGFGGLTNEEVGEVLDISPRTVKREWRIAKPGCVGNLRRLMMPPTSERWARVKKLFDAAVELAPDERAALLAGECDGDTALRHEVESLLESDSQTDGFINSRS